MASSMKGDRGILKSIKTSHRYLPDKKVELRFSQGDRQECKKSSIKVEDGSPDILLRKSLNTEERQHGRQNTLLGSRKRLKCMMPSKSLTTIDRSRKLLPELKKVPLSKSKKTLKFDMDNMDLYAYHIRKSLEQKLQVNKPIVVKNGKPLYQDCCTIY